MYFRIYGNKSIPGKAHALATFIVTQIAKQSVIFQLEMPDYRAWLYSKVYSHPRIVSLTVQDIQRLLPSIEEVNVAEGTDLRALIDEVIHDTHERINGVGARKIRQEVTSAPVDVFRFMAFSDAMADVSADTPELGIGPSRQFQDIRDELGINLVAIHAAADTIYGLMPSEILTGLGPAISSDAIDQVAQMKQAISLLWRFGEEAREENRQVQRNYQGRRDCRADRRDQHRYDEAWVPRKTMADRLDKTIDILYELIAVVPAGERSREINELFNDVTVLKREH